MKHVERGPRQDVTVKEYADFLGSQAPYDELGAEDLERLVRALEVEYFAAGTTIVQADGSPLDHLWVVRTGAVEIVDRGRVVDQLAPGDTFGHISLLTGLPPALSAQALEDSLCLRLPDPRKVLRDPGRLRFSHFGTMIGRERLTRTGTLDHTPGSARSQMRPLVIAEHDDSIADVARLVSGAGHSAALVRRGDEWGVVTDHDFRRRVATGELPPSAPVGELTSFPAIAIGEDFSQAAAFSRMIDHGVHHLVVMDGRGVPEGILRAVDFASAEIRNPLQVRGLIDEADTVEALRAACQLLRPSLLELGAGGMPAVAIGSLHTSIVDAVLRKLVAIHRLGELVPPPSWIVLGSMARREPLPHSDIDTAMVWEGTGAGDARERNIERAEGLLVDMESCGFARCPHGANAVNPLFARSSDEWAATARRWLADPMGDQVLLMSSIVIDSRPLTEVAVGRAVTDLLRRQRRDADFLSAFTKQATAVKPPTGFVRDFVVDHRGEHRGKLDLKRGGLLQIAALGRWVAVVTGDTRGSTLDRVRRGGQLGLLTQDETDTLVAAFEQVYELVMRRQFEAISRGASPTTYVDPGELDSLTRRHLRETFRVLVTIQDAVAAQWFRRVFP
jgi:CBS domain-containing protein